MVSETFAEDVYRLIISRRTVRAFEDRTIPDEILERMVDAARLAPSGANMQPLRFLVVTDDDLRAKVLETLAWAAYIAPRGDPPPGREPQAYVIILNDEGASARTLKHDVAFAAQNLLITGLAHGVAGCMLLAFNAKKITDIFNLPDHLKPEMVIALGFPGENPSVVERSDTVKYWRDETNRHFVPKRPLAEVMFMNRVK
jgi:nitroreductase